MTAVIVILIVALVIVAALAVWTFTQKRRTEHLREQFGPEYDRTVIHTQNRREAEKQLQERKERVERLSIRQLDRGEQTRFMDQWRATQAQFVDDPRGAVSEADRLVGEVMQARGYPMGSFEQRASDISVEHADVVTNYRAAHALAGKASSGDASTDDLRQAMLHYRALFDDLLGAAPVQQTEARR
jgi:hypothetical protein